LRFWPFALRIAIGMIWCVSMASGCAQILANAVVSETTCEDSPVACQGMFNEWAADGKTIEPTAVPRGRSRLYVYAEFDTFHAKDLYLNDLAISIPYGVTRTVPTGVIDMSPGEIVVGRVGKESTYGVKYQWLRKIQLRDGEKAFIAVRMNRIDL